MTVPRGHSRDGGDLLIGKFFILAQYDDLAELYGKLLDGGADLLLLDIAHVGRMGVFRSVRSFIRAIPVQIEFDDLRRSPPLRR
jgi:hypothetical protein